MSERMIQAGRWSRPPGWKPLPPAYWAYGWELRHLEWLRWHGLWPLP